MTNSVLGKRGYGEKGEKGDQGDPGFTSSLLEYTADASQNNSGFLGQNPTNPIQSGRIRFNNSTHANSTALILSSFDRFGRDIDRVLGLIPLGSTIVVQRQTSSQQFVEFTVAGEPIIFDNQFVSIAVTPVGSLGANFSTGDLVYALVAYAGAPGIQGPPGPTGLTGVSFTYRGDWSSTTTYVKNDVVSFNINVPVTNYPNGLSAGTYVCTGDLSYGLPPPQQSQGTAPMIVWNPMALSGLPGSTGPQGAQGIQGPAGATGPQGPAGTAATVTVGSVTTGSAGSSAVVTNSGSSSAAVFNFTIPRGDAGSISSILWEPSDILSFGQVSAPTSTSAFYRKVVCPYNVTITKGWVCNMGNSPTIGLGIYSAAGALLCNGSSSSITPGYNSMTMTAASGGTLSLTAGTQYIITFWGTSLAGTSMFAQNNSVTGYPTGFMFILGANTGSYAWTGLTPPASIASGLSTAVSNGYAIWYAFSNT